MTRVLPLAVAILLACSLPAVAFPAGPSADRTLGPAGGASVADVESDGWLAPSGDSVTSGSGYVALDASATLDADADRLESRYDSHLLDTRLERADSDAERRAIVREETETLESAVAGLREREREAYRAYHAGELDEQQLAVELAAVHTAAVVLERSVSSLSDHAATVPDADRDEEFEALEVQTATLQGPVRERIADVLRGETDPTRVYVEAAGSGVVLATVQDGHFYREAYRADARDPAGESRLHSLGESEERIAELYPEIFPTARWSYSEVGYGAHRGTGTYPEGTITVYLDQATTDVYREHLTLRLDRVDTTPLGEETEDGVRLSVATTAPGGPAVLSLSNADTDAPLSGEVSVDGRNLGETDDEGRIWIVTSRGSTTITASVGSTTIELTLEGSAIEGEPTSNATNESTTAIR